MKLGAFEIYPVAMAVSAGRRGHVWGRAESLWEKCCARMS